MSVQFIVVSFAAILAAGPSHSKDSKRFNLNCVGLISGSIGDGKHETPFDADYTIDLEGRQWCVNPCESPKGIVSVSDTELVLEDDRPLHSGAYLSINRRSGMLLGGLTVVGNPPAKTLNAAIAAQCTKQVYTGIPARKF